jgi:hypothetical protein
MEELIQKHKLQEYSEYLNNPKIKTIIKNQLKIDLNNRTTLTQDEVSSLITFINKNKPLLNIILNTENQQQPKKLHKPNIFSNSLALVLILLAFSVLFFVLAGYAPEKDVSLYVMSVSQFVISSIVGYYFGELVKKGEKQ